MFSISKWAIKPCTKIPIMFIRARLSSVYCAAAFRNYTLIHTNKMRFSSNIKELMEQKLKDYFSPTFLQVNQEETSKFQVIIESEKFAGLPLLKQHREVNEVLKSEIARIHAVSIITKVPQKK